MKQVPKQTSSKLSHSKLSQKDIAAILGVDTKTLYNWRKNKPELYSIVMLGFKFKELLQAQRQHCYDLEQIETEVAQKTQMHIASSEVLPRGYFARSGVISKGDLLERGLTQGNSVQGNSTQGHSTQGNSTQGNSTPPPSQCAKGQRPMKAAFLKTHS